MGLSTNTTIYSGGAQTFPVNFALGFIKRTDVQVRVNAAVDGAGDPVYSSIDWIDDSNITVLDPLTVGDSVEVLRTVSKTELQVDFAQNTDVTPTNLNLSAKQGLMVYQELADGRVEGAESPTIAAARAESAALAAEADRVQTGIDAAAAAASASSLDTSSFAVSASFDTSGDDLLINAGATKWHSLAGSPEGGVTAGVGSVYTDRTGAAGAVLYVKESGSGNTGWVAQGSAGIDAHLNFPTATTDQVLSYDGSDYSWVDNTSFRPTALTGTSPSLDLRSFNFFEQDLSADATLSFASVPTAANWRYAFTPALVGSSTFEVSGLNLVYQDYSIDTTAKGLYFRADGLKMYTAQDSGDKVLEYDLSTAWDTSTMSLVRNFSVTAEHKNPTSVFFKDDGTKMFVSNRRPSTSGGSPIDREIGEYSLSTAWDISTASFVRNFDTTGKDILPTGLFFTPDGTRMYIVGPDSDSVHEYNLGSAWSLSSVSFSRSFSVSSQSTNASHLYFKGDGTKMFVTGAVGGQNQVHEYDLSTAWNVSTASHSASKQILDGNGIFFKSDGTVMFTGGAREHYNVRPLAAPTLPASVQSAPRQQIYNGIQMIYEFYTTDGGTTVHLISENAQGVVL